MQNNISLKGLIKRFWKKTIWTWSLVFLEGSAMLMFPLVIGWAVDDLISKSFTGVFQLAGLCLGLLIVGAARRFYDTRVYGTIYKTVSNEMVCRQIDSQTNISKIAARTNLFSEFIEFLENSVPGLFSHLIGLVGTLVIISFIDIRIFLACLAGAAITSIIFYFSQNKMLYLNKGQNDEFEKQVDLISSHDRSKIKTHFSLLTRWNIRLSDLETINFSLTWVALSFALLFTIVVAGSSETATFGQVITIVMYVFGFIESILTFPLYYQQTIRLQEIASRLG